MVIEIFDDGTEPTPQQKKMMQALMNGGMLRYKQTKDEKVEVGVIPVHDLYPETPKKDAQ